MLKRLFWIGLLSTLLWYGQPTPTLKTLAQNNTPITARVAIHSINNLDPTTLSRFDINGRDVVENLFVGLTRLDAKQGQIVPALANDWEISSDGLTWTFNLRNDIYWMQYQDGEVKPLRPVIADDVVFAIQRACDPRRPSPKTTNIYIVEGCRDVANLLDTWRIDDALLNELIGVKALDETTLQIQLSLATPASYFLTMTTLPEFRPLPRELVIGSGSWPTIATLATSGAWLVESWNESQMVLSHNPNWPLQRGNIERVEVLFTVNSDQVPLRLSSGTLDIARIRHQDTSALTLALDTVIEEHEGGTLYLIGFSFEYPPFDNALVRQALAQAVNRQGLVDYLIQQGFDPFQVATRFTPSSVIAAPTTEGATFNPSVAQQLLATAGYAQCQKFPNSLTLVVHNDALEIAIGSYVVAQWNQNLGCSSIFQVATAPRQAIIDSAHGTVDRSEDSNTGRFALWLLSWTADYPDANAWTNDALHCQFGFFRTGRICDQVDSLLDQGASTFNLAERATLYTQAEAGLFGANGTFPVIPLLQRQSLIGHQRWLTGVAPYGPFQFDQWTISTN